MRGAGGACDARAARVGRVGCVTKASDAAGAVGAARAARVGRVVEAADAAGAVRAPRGARITGAPFTLLATAAAILAAIIALACALAGCTPAKGGSGARYANALYIYMCGSTLETKSAIATQNIDEMLGAHIPDGSAVVVETGGARKWRGHDIPANALVRYEVRGGSLVEVGREADASMGDAQTLSSFLGFCQREYPADNSTLLLWNHGAGSVKGVCLDENHGMDGLSAAELGQALDAADAHLTTVCFDACLMGGFETMRMVAPHAASMVASEEIEPSGGWDYTALVEGLGSADFTEKLLVAYKARNEEKGKRLFTLSAVDLTKFAQVETAFDALCGRLAAQQGDEEALQKTVQAADAAMSFGEGNGKAIAQSNFVDLAQFARNLGADELARAVEGCTRAENGPDREGASGMSVYFPLDGAASLKEYLESAVPESYALFLRGAFGAADGAGAGAGGGADTVEFSDEGSIEGGELRFATDAASARRTLEVAYAVYRLGDGEGGADAQARCLGFDSDVQERGAGAYTIGFSGRWVALNGQLLSCDTIDAAGDTTVFSAAVKRNGEDGELRFTFNAKTGAYALQGFVAGEDAGAQGRLEDIGDGDTITVLAEQFDDPDSTATRLVEVGEVSAADGLALSSATLPDGRYQVYGVVTDIYGEEYTTRDFIVSVEGGAITQARIAGS